MAAPNSILAGYAAAIRPPGICVTKYPQNMAESTADNVSGVQVLFYRTTSFPTKNYTIFISHIEHLPIPVLQYPCWSSYRTL